MKIQNKLGTYLAVTAGVGCAASVAEGAIVVVDLSGVSVAVGGNIALPETDLINDFAFTSQTAFGMLTSASGMFYSGAEGLLPQAGRGYDASDNATFPTGGYGFAIWNFTGYVNTVLSGFSLGENWVAFKDSSGKYGWMSFTLSSLGVNNDNPISSFGYFVYDDASSGPGDAITLQDAVAAAAVPEPSSLVLLALGATGLAARRQRRKAA